MEQDYEDNSEQTASHLHSTTNPVVEFSEKDILEDDFSLFRHHSPSKGFVGDEMQENARIQKMIEVEKQKNVKLLQELENEERASLRGFGV